MSCLFLFYMLEYSDVTIFRENIPFGTGLVLDNVVMPTDRIFEEDIIVLENMIILKIPNVTLSNYAETGSMGLLFNKGANGICIVPKDEKDINVGDIISYRFGEILIVHRVVEKGIDNEGVYFVTRGDNNLIDDEKIRFRDIEYVTVGIIY